jgi:hypothetical protein
VTIIYTVYKLSDNYIHQNLNIFLSILYIYKNKDDNNIV